jgi:hypothetical protein
VNFFYRKPAGPVLSKGGASWPAGRLAPSVQGRGQPVPRLEGSPPAVVTTQEASVAKEAAATEATVAKAATETAATETAVTETAVAEPTATEAAVAEAAVAEAVATPGRRGDVHWADYSWDRRRRGGISCRGGAEKHCAGHRACADCAGGDAAGRRE